MPTKRAKGWECLPPIKETGMSTTKGVRSGGNEKASMNTRLLEKSYSPLVVRKYQLREWPLFVGIICDVDISDLDEVVNEAEDDFEKEFVENEDIQTLRNFCGHLTNKIRDYYNKEKRNSVEGVAVIWYTDKCFISSLSGDFMTHHGCKMELYQIINTLPHI